MEQNFLLRDKIQGFKTLLPDLVIDAHFRLRPDLKEAYSELQIRHYKNDIAWVLSFLSEAVWAGQSVLFEDFISWLKTFLTALQVPLKDVEESLIIAKDELNKACSAQENLVINQILDKGIELLMNSSNMSLEHETHSKLSDLANRFLEKLLMAERYEAIEIIISKARSGMSVKEIYLDVFIPVLHEIGLLWQMNQISIAKEHYCTGVTQLTMDQLHPFLFNSKRKNLRIMTFCVSGEMHEIGARIVTDFFEMDGWDTHYLGANLPVETVIDYIIETKPNVVAISATMSFHLSTVEEMIKRIRLAEGTPPNMKIMVGGYPFRVSGRLWQAVGADMYASGAEDAVILANKLISA